MFTTNIFEDAEALNVTFSDDESSEGSSSIVRLSPHLI